MVRTWQLSWCLIMPHKYIIILTVCIFAEHFMSLHKTYRLKVLQALPWAVTQCSYIARQCQTAEETSQHTCEIFSSVMVVKTFNVLVENSSTVRYSDKRISVIQLFDHYTVLLLSLLLQWQWSGNFINQLSYTI